MSKELQTAVAAAQTALEQRALIECKIEEAAQELREIEADLEYGKARLGAAEADVALGGDAKAATVARKALAQLRDTAETVEARIGGLRARLAQLDGDLPAGLRALREAIGAGFNAARADWLPRWTAALEQLRDVVLEAKAMEVALGGSTPAADHFRELLDAKAVDEAGEPIAPTSTGGALGRRFLFDQSPAAARVLEQNGDVRSVEAELTRVCRSLEQQARADREQQPASERRAQAVPA